MDEERYQQKELFEFQKPKRSFPRLSLFCNRAEFAGKAVLVLTLEKIVFAAIGMIMLLVGVYAIGVEKGRTAGKTIETIPPTGQPEPPRISPPAPSSQGPQIAPPPDAAPKSAVMKGTPAKTVTADAGRPYTVIAATFSNRKTADREANGLRKDGFDAGVAPANQYFQVCIGSYAARDSAQNALKKVRQRYKDAYIKIRR